MSGSKMDSCFKAKDKIFSEAATIIITKESPENCCDQLKKVKSEMIEAFDTLKATDTHQPYEDRYNSTIDSIENMISFLQKPTETETKSDRMLNKSASTASTAPGNVKEPSGPTGPTGPTKNKYHEAGARPKVFDHTQTDNAKPLVAGNFAPPGKVYSITGGSNPLYPSFQPGEGPNLFFSSNVGPTDPRSGTGGGLNSLFGATPNYENDNQSVASSRHSHNNDDIHNFAGASLLNTAQSNSNFANQNASTDLMLAQMLQRSRINIPKPQKFYGDLLKFASWARSFHSLIVQSGLTSAELFPYLKECLGGAAWDAVNSLDLQDSPNLYEEAVAKLRRDFGDPVVVAAAYIKNLQKYASIPKNNPEKLKQFLNDLETCKAAKEMYPTLRILDFPSEMNNIIAKLPVHMISRWNRKASDSYNKQGQILNFKDLCSFVRREVEILTNPLTCPFLVIKPDAKKDEKNQGGSTKTAKTYSTDTKNDKKSDVSKSSRSINEEKEGTGGQKVPKCFYCSNNHWLDKCEKILKIDMPARHQFIQATRLCFSCLRKGHIAQNCKYRLTCRVCKRKHATILHREQTDKSVQNANTSAVAMSDSESDCSDEGTDSAESANTMVKAESYNSKVKMGRICMPLTVEEYKVGQLYMIARHSLEQSGAGEGVEIVKNEPCEDPKHGKGQYTEKRVHLSSRLPTWIQAVTPRVFYITERAWNYYPYTITEYTCSFIPKFSIHIETKYENNNGSTENCLDINEEELADREVIYQDIATDPISEDKYKAEEDPTKFKSEKTGRGPLAEGWRDTTEPIMCSYKAVRVKFEVWGLQGSTESFAHGAIKDVLLLGHRQAFTWIDEWINMTVEDVRAYEKDTHKKINQKVGITNTSAEGAEGGEEATASPYTPTNTPTGNTPEGERVDQ